MSKFILKNITFKGNSIDVTYIDHADPQEGIELVKLSGHEILSHDDKNKLLVELYTGSLLTETQNEDN